MCRPNRRPDGFTLVELLVVIAIMALATGLGGGLYVGSYKRMQVEQSAKDVLLLARYARLSAIARQKPYQMHVDQANRRCWLTTAQRDVQTLEASQTVVMTPGCKPVTLAGSTRFELVDISSSAMADPNGTSLAITFVPGGSADTATIQIGDQNTHYTVRVFGATGKVRIEPGPAKESEDTTIDLEAI